MTEATFTLVFEDGDGDKRKYEAQLPVGRAKFEQGERRLFREITADLTVATQTRTEPKHNATARAWLDFPNATYDFSRFDDVYNSQEIWRELCNLILSVEHDLADANGYKSLEPGENSRVQDDDGIEYLHYLHRRKMEYLNRAVYGLIKVQDLVNRLLHESLGGDLVDTSSVTWERDELNRKNIRKGLNRKAEQEELPRSTKDAIIDALAPPASIEHHDVVVDYRNRLTHHVNPSVDYSVFYAAPRSRVGVPVINVNGKITCWTRTLHAEPPVCFTFATLYHAYLEYLDAVVAMIERLARIEGLRL